MANIYHSDQSFSRNVEKKEKTNGEDEGDEMDGK
jgi:hypothetical protein